MIDEYFVNTQVFVTALYIVIPSVLAGVVASKLKRTKTERRFILAGLAGIAASSLVFFASAMLLTSFDECCEIDMIELDSTVTTFFSSLRFLSTPFAIISVCFFYRGLSQGFNRRHIIETSIMLMLIWMLLFFR